MKKQTVLKLFIVYIFITACPNIIADQQDRVDMTEAMKQSLIYLKTYFYGYEQHQPWKHRDLSESWACACAVGQYQVITTAWNVANIASIKARRFAQNEFISAKIKIVDYERNLCLIDLDPNEMAEPLKPLKFSEDYQKGDEVGFYWLSSEGDLYNGRGYLDRARVEKTSISYEKQLDYVVANTSQRTGTGQLYCVGSEPIGIACWSNKEKEAGLIPAELINAFLAEAAKDKYKGFGAVGFQTSELLDPTMRSYLKMPSPLKTGVYVTDVYTLGTASDIMKKADVLLAIDGVTIDSQGQFVHPKYGRLAFPHLITSKAVGETIAFDLWREGRQIQLQSQVKNFKASDMLVPYHEFDRQPEYVITGGFLLQKLTLPYMTEWGEDWQGKVSAHLFHYYRDMAFKPADQRRDIVILSYVLPANINLGYNTLRQIVVSKFNGMTIRSIEDVLTAQKLNPDSGFDVIEFEFDNPLVVIDRRQLPAADALIGANYGITRLVNINK